MKKILYGVLAVLMVLLLTGCGKERKLSCTQTNSGIDDTFNVGFKGNIIKEMDFHYNYDLSDRDDKTIEAIKKQDFCATVKESMSDYKNAFTDCKYGLENKVLKVDAVLDVDKVATSAMEKMTSAEKAKEELEKQGYKCTIK